MRSKLARKRACAYICSCALVGASGHLVAQTLTPFAASAQAPSTFPIPSWLSPTTHTNLGVRLIQNGSVRLLSIHRLGRQNDGPTKCTRLRSELSSCTAPTTMVCGCARSNYRIRKAAKNTCAGHAQHAVVLPP